MTEIVAPERADLQDEQVSGDIEPDQAETSTRTRRRMPLGLIAGLALVVVFIGGTIGPPLFGRGVFLGSDLIYTTYPWRATAEVVDYGDYGPVSDTVDGAYPVKASFGEAARSGDWQSWTPLVAGGTPLAPTMSGVVSPFALAYVVFPAWFAPAMEKLLQLIASIGFTYLFCRRIGTDRGAALFGGLAFAGSGFMVMWTNWDQPNVATWIPALFWAAELFIQTRSMKSLALISVALAGMLLGLFPTVVFYALYILGPYVAVRLLAQRDWSWVRRITSGLGVGAGMVGGICLAAIAMLPFAARLGDQELSYRQQGPGSHLHLSNLVTTIAPRALGLSTDGPNRGYFGSNQVEGLSFLGMSTVLLALLCIVLPAPKRMPRGTRAVIGVATLVVILATYNGGTLLQFLQNFPAFDNSFVGRTRSVLGFTAAVLAALGIQSLVERRWPEKGWRWAWAGGVAVAAGLGAFAVLRAVRDAMPPAPHITDVKGAFILPALVAVGVVAAVFGLRSQRKALQFGAMGGLLGLLLVESLALSVPLLPNEDRADLYPSTPGIEFLQDTIGDGSYEADGRIMYGDATMLYGLRRMAGHVFYQPTWKQMLIAADGAAFRLSPTYPQFRPEVEVASSPVFDRFGTDLWVGSPGLPFGEREPSGLTEASCDEPADLGSAPATFDLPAGSAVRGVVVRVCAVTSVPSPATLVGSSAGADGESSPRDGVTRLAPLVAPGEMVVPIPEADTTGPQTVTVSLTDAEGNELPLAATPTGDVAIDVVRATDDGLRLLYADDLYVYERENALPRIRWAGSSEVVPDREDRLDMLADGDLDADTVMLDSPADYAGSGRSAEVDVVQDDPERIEMQVDAAGDGFVVVADAIQNDWVATVDGQTAELQNGDHAGVAVAVPDGEHDVVLQNRPRGQRIGLLVSVATVLLLAAAIAAERWLPGWRRRRRQATATP